MLRYAGTRLLLSIINNNWLATCLQRIVRDPKLSSYRAGSGIADNFPGRRDSVTVGATGIYAL